MNTKINLNEVYEWYKDVSIERLTKAYNKCEDEFLKTFILEVINLKKYNYPNKNIKNMYNENGRWIIITTEDSLTSFCCDISNDNDNEILINAKSLDENNILQIRIITGLNSYKDKPKYIYNDIDTFIERISYLCKKK